MDGTISTKKGKIIKIFYGVSIPLTVLFLAFFVYKRFTINFANMDVALRFNGIEYLPVYSALAISTSFLLICLICCVIFKSKSKSSVIIKGAVLAALFIAVLLSYFISANSVETVTYISERYTEELSPFFPIDQYDYDGSAADFYSYKEVTFNNVYWMGNSSYKFYEAEDLVTEWTSESGDLIVFMNYYYLNDDTGKKVAEYERKKNHYDTFYALDDYIDKQETNGYEIYENENSYELFFVNETEVFYLSASKNEKTVYDCNDLVNIAEELKSNLQRQANISK